MHPSNASLRSKHAEILATANFDSIFGIHHPRPSVNRNEPMEGPVYVDCSSAKPSSTKCDLSNCGKVKYELASIFKSLRFLLWCFQDIKTSSLGSLVVGRDRDDYPLLLSYSYELCTLRVGIE